MVTIIIRVTRVNNPVPIGIGANKSRIYFIYRGNFSVEFKDFFSLWTYLYKLFNFRYGYISIPRSGINISDLYFVYPIPISIVWIVWIGNIDK